MCLFNWHENRNSIIWWILRWRPLDFPFPFSSLREIIVIILFGLPIFRCTSSHLIPTVWVFTENYSNYLIRVLDRGSQTPSSFMSTMVPLLLSIPQDEFFSASLVCLAYISYYHIQTPNSYSQLSKYTDHFRTAILSQSTGNNF